MPGIQFIPRAGCVWLEFLTESVITVFNVSCMKKVCYLIQNNRLSCLLKPIATSVKLKFDLLGFQ